jgi:putative FmdB family regulatory protein
MPLYKYRCSDCQEEFEELVSFSQSEEVVCPKCGSHNTRKLVSTFAALRGGNGSSSVSCGGSSGFT